jgi:hypothetical protein
MPRYTYAISGTDARDSRWSTSGAVETGAEFLFAVSAALNDAARTLTKGNAGPGVTGICLPPPYTIAKLTIEASPEGDASC